MLKKIVFFIPAIIFAAAFAAIGMGMGLSFSPVAYVWIALFILSGILLWTDRFWGAFFGIVPGLQLILMSTQYTGQVMNIEGPLGIAVVAFFALCGIRVFKKGAAD